MAINSQLDKLLIEALKQEAHYQELLPIPIDISRCSQLILLQKYDLIIEQYISAIKNNKDRFFVS